MFVKPSSIGAFVHVSAMVASRRPRLIFLGALPAERFAVEIPNLCALKLSADLCIPRRTDVARQTQDGFFRGSFCTKVFSGTGGGRVEDAGRAGN